MRKVKKFEEQKQSMDPEFVEGWIQLHKGLTDMDFSSDDIDDPFIKQSIYDIEKNLKKLQDYIDSKYDWNV